MLLLTEVKVDTETPKATPNKGADSELIEHV
jgi:hypothetical protein